MAKGSNPVHFVVVFSHHHMTNLLGDVRRHSMVPNLSFLTAIDSQPSPDFLWTREDRTKANRPDEDSIHKIVLIVWVYIEVGSG